MSCECEYDFSSFQSDSTVDTFPTAASELKKGDHVLNKSRPCRITEIAKVKVGKHGAIKCIISGHDIFNDRRIDCVCPGDYSLPCPFITKKEYYLMDIVEERRLSLMDEESNEVRQDLDLPLANNEDLACTIRAHYKNGKSLMLTVIKACGSEQVFAFKIDGR